ncbi:MAG: LysE family translocator [Candidatus Puniceispirillaceae bacterium]
MSVSDWLSLALICILGATSPGPSLAVVLAVSRLHGRRGGYAAAIGHGLGVFFCALIAAASLSYILKQHASLFQAVQITGALMLVWIGGRLLMSTRRRGQDQPPAAPSLALSQSFRHGFAIAVFNPKIAAFFASLFSQYLAEGQSTGLHLAMASLAGGIDMVVYLMVVLLATTQLAARIFTKFAGLNDLILGSILLGFGTILLSQNLVI